LRRELEDARSLADTRSPGTILAMRNSILAISSLLLSLSIATAEPLGPGMQMPAITLADQHDVQATIGPETRVVIFARDMDAADIVEEALADGGAKVLADAGAVFISDIHRMPGIITRLFALPAMRKRPYRMLLDREADVTESFPSQEEKVSLIRLDELEIEGIEYFDSAAALRAALLAAAGTERPLLPDAN
jgi:hypothetical protein